MSWTTKHPAANRAFWARWRDVWNRRLESGAHSRDEEDSERRKLIEEVTGKQSTKDLDRTEFQAVFMAMGVELGSDSADPYQRDPARVARERKILALEASEDYLNAIVRRTNPEVESWRNLNFADLHKLLLTLETRARRSVSK